MSKFGRKIKQPPPGFEDVEPTLSALDNELREKVNEPHEGLRKTESVWPVHQINWQRSRYIYDMFYTYKRISREVYDYCIGNKLVDPALIAKWKKPGYERLCSTYAINPKNYKFGTVSICRVPKHSLAPGTEIEDPITGCRGCASGSGGNIFGNKYGQYLAAIQIAREQRAARLAAVEQSKVADNDSDEEAEEDDDDEPGPKASHYQGQEEDDNLGPVVSADGGTGKKKDAVWAQGEDENVELDEAMIGHLAADAEAEARSAARHVGKSGAAAGGGGAGKGQGQDLSSYGPPGKRNRHN